MFNLPGLNKLMPPLPLGLPFPLLPLPLPGLNLPLPGLPQGGNGPKVQGDQNQVQPTGGFGAGVSGNGVADIDNVNLDNAELRALDNLMQTYLADGKFTKEEQKTYQEIRSLFGRSGLQAPANPPAGGGVTTPPSTPTPPSSPQPTDCWPVGEKNANGRTFKSWGDPHEVSGDGGKFDNMKQGTFTKLKSASGDFEVQTTQDKDKSGRWPGATLNHKAAVKSGNDVVAYDGLAKSLTINGQKVDMPKPGQSVDLPGGGKVVGTADGVQIQTAKGDKVNIHQKDSSIDSSGEISPNRKDGEVRGSIGAFDADTTAGNDLVGRDGKQYNMGNKQSLDAFLEDWRVKPGEDLFAPKNPAGGGGPVGGGNAAAEAEFKALDKTGNGYLSGSEITPELKAAFPGKERITKEDFVGWKAAQLEAKAVAADEAEFAKRDINQDGQLDGNEVGDAAQYDKGGNWQRPDGTTQTEISKAEFMAGRAAARKAAATAPVNPPAGGGVQTEGPKPGDDIPAIANVRKAKRKKKKRGFFSRLTRNISRMAGKVFRVATNIAFAPIRTAAAITGGALNIATNLAQGNVGGAFNAGAQGVTNVVRANDPFDGIRLS